MKCIRRAAISMCLLVGISGEAGAGQADDCLCWYQGFEDGLEFSWDNRAFAERYTRCAKTGKVKLYEDGFKASQNSQARKCPLID